MCRALAYLGQPVLLDNLLHLFRTSSLCHAASLAAGGITDQD